MAFILAPYNNAMRLGQGFNTYTQQICIDDAVVVDPGRSENVLTNDGNTMRILVQSMGRPSAWSRQKEVVEDNAIADLEAGPGSEYESTVPTRVQKPIQRPQKPLRAIDVDPAEGDDSILTDETLQTTTDVDGEATQDDGVLEDDAAGVEGPEPEISGPASEEHTKDADAEIDTSPEVAQDESEVKADAPSETGSGDLVVVGGSEKDSESDAVDKAETEMDKPSKRTTASSKLAAAVNASKLKTRTSPKSNGKLETAEPQATKAALTGTKPSAGQKAAGAVRAITASKAIGRAKGGNRSQAKNGVDWDQYASQDASKVDWEEYKSQQARAELEAEERAARLEEERERQREEREIRRQVEREKREDEKERRQQDRELRKQLEKERWEEEKQMREAERKQRAEDAAWKREQEKARRAEQKANVEWATSTQPYTAEEKAAMKKEMDTSFEERFKGMLENQKEFEFDEASVGGPSQIVTYTSRFVDKLSDITDDMNISGSLCIKAGKIGGSGKGAFINTDKFKESDLNFYISVKVVNQTINFKDALVFNPCRSVNKENFNTVFGDGFISGFQEGGEFNALVSMKILNKAKKTDIKAEAKVAFTAGPIDVKAEANVDIAKANIETNTETTIQVSWSGGGHIKPREQQWDIQSLMQAAARFPDLVAKCPQRIYAIITKYDALRSFVKTKPAGYTKLQYENAQIYTNAMMDSFMTYKSLYTSIGSRIFDVQSKTKIIKPWDEGQNEPTAETKEITTSPATTAPARQGLTQPPIHDTSKFPATIAGLSLAKKAIRHQMTLIVNEVDAIEQDPKLATDEDHYEPFQDPAAFEERIPRVEPPQKTKPTMPLSGKRIMAKTETEGEQAQEGEDDQTAPALMADNSDLDADEQAALENYLAERPMLGKNIQLTPPMGSQSDGTIFNNLEILQPQWKLSTIFVEIFQGAVVAFWIYYDNGLTISRGKAKGGRQIEFSHFQTAERIASISLQTGKASGKTSEQVIAIIMHTNRGRSFIGQAATCSYEKDVGQHRDGVLFTDVKTKFFEVPLTKGTLKGFYGRADDVAIWRLGFIWGDLGVDQAHDGVTDSAPADEAADPITQSKLETASAKAETTRKQTEIDSLKTQLNDYMQQKENLNSQVNTLNSQLGSRNGEVEQLKRSALPWTRGDGWRRGRVHIYFVTYGGSLIWDGNVVSRLLDYANNRSSFEVSDGEMGCDPWQGYHKTMEVIYRLDDTGELRCLTGRQGSRVQFDQ